MKYPALVLFLLFVGSSCSTTYYIVRHAEKETAAPNMSSDVELTTAGKERAERLKTILYNQHIGIIFSTKTIRTSSTAKPLSDATGIPIQYYSPKDTTDLFIQRLKAIKGKNVLIVGHSNTVDDLVNQLTGKQLLKDLEETEYNNLFVVRKKGKKYHFHQKKY